MESRDYLDLLRRRWRSILVTALTVLALTALVTFLSPQKYTATTQLFFGVQGGETISDLAQGSSFTQDQMDSYARVAVSPLVLNPVIKELGLDTTPEALAQDVTATVPMNTVILEISVTERDADQAVTVANEVGKQFTAVVGDLLPQRAADTRTVRAKVFAAAQRPTAPSSPRVGLNFAVGLLLALVLSIGIALLRQVFNSKVKTEQDLRSVTDSPLLGVVPRDVAARAYPEFPEGDVPGALGDAVARLRSNLKLKKNNHHLTSLVVTSSVAQEGKSTTVTSLAVSMASAGMRVIVVDADLRRALQKVSSGRGRGLTSVLQGEATLAEAVNTSTHSGVDVLPSGPSPAHKSELLESESMGNLVRHLSSTYDLVLIDSPPLLVAADALDLSMHADATLLVVGADVIKRAELKQALSSLSTAEVQLVGLVLNKVDRHATAVPARNDASTFSWPTEAVDQTVAQREPGAVAVVPAGGSSPWKDARF